MDILLDLLRLLGAGALDDFLLLLPALALLVTDGGSSTCCTTTHIHVHVVRLVFLIAMALEGASRSHFL